MCAGPSARWAGYEEMLASGLPAAEAADEAEHWNTLADKWFDRADAAKLTVTYWCAGGAERESTPAPLRGCPNPTPYSPMRAETVNSKASTATPSWATPRAFSPMISTPLTRNTLCFPNTPHGVEGSVFRTGPGRGFRSRVTPSRYPSLAGRSPRRSLDTTRGCPW